MLNTIVYRKIHWKIENLTREIVWKYYRNKSIIQRFAIKGHQWLIELSFSINEDWKFYFLKFRSSNDKDFLFKMRLFISTADDSLKQIDQIQENVNHLKENEGFSFNLFKFNEFFSDYDYLKDETLNFVIEIELHSLNEELDEKPNEPKNLISPLDFEKLITNESLSDFTIICSDQGEVSLHRVLIALKCPLFMELIESETEHGSHRIAFTDITSQTMKTVLRFIYTNDLDTSSNITSNLLYAAEKFRLKDLKQKCLTHLNQNINLQNVFDTFSIATFYNESVLEENCIGFIKMKIDQLNNMESWAKLNTTQYVKIIRSLSRKPIITHLKDPL